MRESEAGSPRIAAARGISAVKTIEDVGQILGCDAVAIVLDGKLSIHKGTIEQSIRKALFFLDVIQKIKCSRFCFCLHKGM